MVNERVTDGLICIGRALAATAVLSLAGCGGGDSGREELQAMPSSTVGGQVMSSTNSIQKTNRPLDVAIDGDGAFVLRDPRNGTQVLSRLGHFDIDSMGRLVNDEGWLVEGVSDNQVASTLAALAPLPAISAQMPPVATRKVVIEANLDSRAGAPNSGSAAPLAFDPSDPITYNCAVSVSVHDAAGKAISLTLYFRKMAPAIWNVYASVNGLAVPPNDGSGPLPVVELNFSPNGSSPINLADMKPLPPVVIDAAAVLGKANTDIAPFELNMSLVTSYAANFSVTDLRQDGSPANSLTAVSVKPTGELVLAYGDFRVDDSRRLVLARTTVADRLSKYGASGWICGQSCQSPVVTRPGQMLTGTLVPAALNAGD